MTINENNSSSFFLLCTSNTIVNIDFIENVAVYVAVVINQYIIINILFYFSETIFPSNRMFVCMCLFVLKSKSKWKVLSMYLSELTKHFVFYYAFCIWFVTD